MIEKDPHLARNKTHLELLQAKDAEAEEEAEEEEEEEEGEEGDEEGEEGGEEEDYGEEEEEEYDFEGIEDLKFKERYFNHGEHLRNKFNEVELDSFMRLLNVKPYKQWEDKSVHHYKLGVHTYEDDSQMLDPMFHLLGEVERKHADRLLVE